MRALGGVSTGRTDIDGCVNGVSLGHPLGMWGLAPAWDAGDWNSDPS